MIKDITERSVLCVRREKEISHNGHYGHNEGVVIKDITERSVFYVRGEKSKQ